MKNNVSAIFSEDIKQFLEKNGELEKLLNGQTFCLVCDNIMDINNIQLIIPNRNKGFDFVCDRPDCIEKYYEIK